MRNGIVRAALCVGLLASAVALTTADTVDDFLAQHWRAPLAAQGPPPPRYSPIEASLRPEDCGTCHPTQFADWRTSLHAHAMSPGVSGQLVEMFVSDPGSAVGCFTCHAPLAEQAPLVAGASGLVQNPAHDPALQQRGVACAACHVRRHERFGPPRRDGRLASDAPREALPHGGVTRTAGFLRSEFCRGCHQFEPDGFALNGKLLENTYREWKASRVSREGVQCQDCHMPDRRHLWRGIHDPDTVRSGLTITVTHVTPRARPGQTFSATFAVKNTGVGHAFPTYVTPRVVMRAELLDEAGEVLEDSRREHVIGRDVALDLSREIADTRLAPGQAAVLRYQRRIDRPGLRARFRVIVYPDAFYTRFFERVLQAGAGRGAEEIREALARSRSSPFTVYVKEFPLG